MKKFLTTIGLIWVLIFGLASVGCNNTATVKKAQDLADELRAINHKLAKANNDAADAHKIPLVLHKAVNGAVEKFSQSLDTVDAAIIAAKVVTSKEDAQSKLDFIQRLFDTDVFLSFANVAATVIDFPPEIKAQMQAILAGAQLVFASIRALFAEAQTAIKEGHYA